MATTLPGVLIGGLVTFFDTLGIGNFATTTAIVRRFKMLDDTLLPGTLNVGHCLPTIAQAIIFTQIVAVDRLTLVSMVAAAVIGGWGGAGVVARMPRRGIQFGMGIALAIFAIVMILTAADLMPGGGESFALRGGALVIAILGNLMLGALMTLGIGLYAPCMVMVYLLGMHPTAAFPIMMGSCAVLMPVASWRFIRAGRYDRNLSLGFTLGGIPAVIVAAKLFSTLSLDGVRIVVIVVVVWAAVDLLRSALTGARNS